jgi:hypothetical protein
MSSVANPISFISVSGLTPGQVALVNYVHTMGQFDDSPFARDAFSRINLPESIACAIREGRRSTVEGPFLSAASLAARAVKQERLLTRSLGEAWLEESRFVPAVHQELTELRSVIGAARYELKLWRNALRGFRFDGIEDPDDAIDLSGEEPLGSLLHDMQIAFLYRIQGAREILEDYGGRSLAGLEAYFQVRRVRRSGPIAKVVEEAIGETGKKSG